jgi:c-di-GMP-binding flagellar brake protein YcgR
LQNHIRKDLVFIQRRKTVKVKILKIIKNHIGVKVDKKIHSL